MKRVIYGIALIVTLSAVIFGGCNMKTIAEMKAERDISGLINFLQNDDSATRMEAINALGELGDKIAVRYLVDALSDNNQSVREAAGKALDSLSWTPVTDNEKAYYLAAKGQWDAAVKLGEPSVTVLLQFMKYDDVKEKALDSIVRIGEPAIPLLISGLKNSTTKDAAATALNKIGGLVKDLLLKSLKEDGDWRDRTVALSVLENQNWKARSLKTGVELIASPVGGEGELTVKNGLKWDALIIISQDSNPVEAVRSVYIKANESYTIIDIPDGKFRLYYSLGKDWDSDAKKFTIAEEYSRFEETLSFETDWRKGRVATYEVTLYPVSGGMAETENLKEVDFPKLNGQ
jgi:hypothetical protein